MTNTQIKKLNNLQDALYNAEYHEGKGTFKGFGRCTRSDIEILRSWVESIRQTGHVYSIEFEEPYKIMKKYGLTDLVN